MRIVKHAETCTTFFHFDDCRDFADTVEKTCTPRSGGGRWVNGETWATSVKRARSGDTDLVPVAETLVDKIVVEAQRESPQWTLSVAGAFPCVPAYLAGRPDCMNRRIIEPNDRAPVRIYVELTSSGGIDAETLVKRGTAILALALLLNTHRSVELNVVIGLNVSYDGAAFAVIPLGTTPLDISLACNALTSVGFCRSMGYQYLNEHAGSGGGWAWQLVPEGANRTKYVERLRGALGASPQDIIIPPSFYTDDLIIRDPVEFVKRSLDEALQIEQGE